MADLFLLVAMLGELIVEVSHSSRRMGGPIHQDGSKLDNRGSNVVGHVVHFQHLLDLSDKSAFLSSVSSTGEAEILGIKSLEECHERLGPCDDPSR